MTDFDAERDAALRRMTDRLAAAHKGALHPQAPADQPRRRMRLPTGEEQAVAATLSWPLIAILALVALVLLTGVWRS